MNNLNDRATAQDFGVRASAPVQRATGFGASAAPVRASAPAAAPAPRSAGFGGASFGGGGSSGPRTAPRSKPGH